MILIIKDKELFAAIDAFLVNVAPSATGAAPPLQRES